MNTWRPVVGHEGRYEVSDDGAVRSVDRPVTDSRGRVYRYPGRPLNAWLDRDGYPRVALSGDGHVQQRPVHKLVAEAFIGPCPLGQQVRHRNGQHGDPRAVNLRYGTPSENQLDSVEHGTHGRSSRERCLRGHRFISANLDGVALRQGVRLCRACRLAGAVVRRAAARGETLDIQAVADAYFAKLETI